MQAGVRLVNKKFVNCVTSAHSNPDFEIRAGVCNRNTYQPQIFTIENKSEGFYIIIRNKNWVNHKVCLSAKGLSVIAELCDTSEPLRYKWLFLYTDNVTGYFLYHIEDNVFIRATANDISAQPEFDTDDSYTWNIVQCEGNSKINTTECIDFWETGARNPIVN